LTLQIRQIIETQQAWIDTMTEWMHAWWGEPEGHTEESVRMYLMHGMQDKRLPQTYGMFLDDKLIGMYQFRLDDLFVRPDIYPWLANVYIDEPYRGQGYGQKLMKSVLKHARQNIPFDEIYLFTKHIGFYEKFGWKFISEIDTCLEDCRIQRLYRLEMKSDLQNLF
jgi:GNAT superfamily N-acetyltransferase